MLTPSPVWIRGLWAVLSSHFDIPVDSARQAAYRASVARNLANLLYGAKVTRTRDGKARLNNVHVHAHQLAGDEELFLGIHAGARRLLTVAQGGVKDCNFAAYMFLLIDRFMTDGFQEREGLEIEKYPCRSSRLKAADDSAPGYNKSL